MQVANLKNFYTFELTMQEKAYYGVTEGMEWPRTTRRLRADQEVNQILFIITFFMYDIFHIDHLCGTRGEMADGEEILFTSNQGKSHANFYR